MNLKLLALIMAFTAAGVCPSLADGRIGVGLYLGENTPPLPGAKLASEKMAQRLYSVFGYPFYKLVKVEDIEMDHEWQQWSVPRNDFFIRVEPLPRQPGEPRLVYYEIYQNGFIIAHGRYEPHHETPLFIGGPYFKKGQFIFVLEQKEQ